jgi:hypothetical protein
MRQFRDTFRDSRLRRTPVRDVLASDAEPSSSPERLGAFAENAMAAKLLIRPML